MHVSKWQTEMDKIRHGSVVSRLQGGYGVEPAQIHAELRSSTGVGAERVHLANNMTFLPVIMQA